jgi:hypothetical protein
MLVQPYAVASFGGFLELCERVLATKKGDGKNSGGGRVDDSSQAAAIIAAAVSGCLGKAVDSVHAAGGDVIRMVGLSSWIQLIHSLKAPGFFNPGT